MSRAVLTKTTRLVFSLNDNPQFNFTESIKPGELDLADLRKNLKSEQAERTKLNQA